MTDLQARRFYWPAWNRAATALGWRMQGGRLVGTREDVSCATEWGKIYVRTWQYAEQVALRDHRAVEPSDLRHGVHVAALQRDRSHRDLSNAEVDRVVDALNILAQHEDVRAMERWIDQSIAARHRQTWWIKNCCVEGYARYVCRDKFGTDDWGSLPAGQLRELYVTLRNRRHALKAA